VGNNLPAQRWNGTTFIDEEQQVDGTTTWENGSIIRTRTPQVTKLADVGASDRGNGLGEAPGNPNSFSDGFWEKSAAEKPRSPLDGVGGLRVITSAGVYDRTNSFLPPPTWISIVRYKENGSVKNRWRWCYLRRPGNSGCGGTVPRRVARLDADVTAGPGF
jgi:hypothetical protein